MQLSVLMAGVAQAPEVVAQLERSLVPGAGSESVDTEFIFELCGRVIDRQGIDTEELAE